MIDTIGRGTTNGLHSAAGALGVVAACCLGEAPSLLKRRQIAMGAR